MFRLFVLALLAVSCSGAQTPEPSEGILHKYLNEVKNWLHISPLRCYIFNEHEVKFYLYTKQVPYAVEIDINNDKSLRESSFDGNREIEIIVHDWLFGVNYTHELVTAYLRHSKRPVNVIQIDYSAYSQCEGEDFMKPRIYGNIAKKLAKLLQKLHQSGSKSTMMHIVGFGSGAHIAGAAAKEIVPLRVARISGLDPIGFNFDEDRSLPQLTDDAADYVDVIWTCAGLIGSKYPRGNTHFYPNGGYTQDGDIKEKGMLQSHLKAVYYFVESVARGRVFKAYSSYSYAAYSNGKYDRENYNWMGEDAMKNATGKFFLDVNSYPPYGKERDMIYESHHQVYDEDVYSHSYLPTLDQNMQLTLEKVRSKYQEMPVESEEHQSAKKRSY